MPMMDTGFILEALGSPLSPADPLPFSGTLQDVLSLPRKSSDHFSRVQLHEGWVAHGGPESHCSQQQTSQGIGGGLVEGQGLSLGRRVGEVGRHAQLPLWDPGSAPRGQHA